MFKNKLSGVLLVCTALALTSCATVKSVNNLSKVYVTNTKQINLLPPQDIESPIDDIMLLNGDFGDVSFTLKTLVQADDSGLYFSLLNDFGTDMGTIEYDGIDAIADTPILPEKLKPEYIINDFQNAFYKVSKITENLNKSNLDLKVIKEGEKEIRQVWSGKKLVEEVTVTSAGAIIVNHLRGYSFGLYFFQ